MVKITGAEGFSLVIESENLAAWMPIVNTFTLTGKEKPYDRYWNGVLIQLGKYEKCKEKDTDDKMMKGFLDVKLISQHEVVASIESTKFSTDKENPTWINIVAKPENSAPLPPNEPDPHGPMPNAIDPEKLWMKGKEVRSLDRFLSPLPGGITLWSKNGYLLNVANSHRHFPHKEYTFTLASGQSCDIEITGPGAPGLKKDQVIDRIVICERPKEEGERQQGGHQSPPQGS